VAAERLSSFCYELNLVMAQKMYFQTCYNYYSILGARAKCVLMEGEMHAAGLTQHQRASSESNASVNNTTVLEHVTKLMTSEGNIRQIVEAISMIILQHAGANRGFIFFTSDEELYLLAKWGDSDLQVFPLPTNKPNKPSSGDLREEQIIPVPEESEEESTEESESEEPVPLTVVATTVPLPLIMEVFGSGIPVTINDNNDLPEYMTDQNVKSICCLPMRNQGKNMGILYLENTLTKYAFPLQQQIMLEHLAGQIANSIERTHLNINLQMTLETVQRRNELLVNLDTMKDEFVRTTSHELRTPLNAILGLTDVLRETKLNARQHHFCDSIYSSAEALLLIINDILDFQACQKNELSLSESKFELRTCLDECIRVSSTNRAQGVVLNLFVDQFLSDDVFVECDRMRLQQVISNLLSNALKFTEQGNVVVSARLVEQQEEMITVLFKVKDTGIGIAEENIGNLFKAFSQIDTKSERKFAGTGLGLALSQHIVKALSDHQAEISCQSTQGKGACFSFPLQLRYFRNPTPKPFQGTRPVLKETLLMVVSQNARTIRAIRAELDSVEFRGMEVVASLTVAMNTAKLNFSQLPPRKQILIFDTDVMSPAKVDSILSKHQTDFLRYHISLVIVGAYDQRSQLLACVEESQLNKMVLVCCRPFPKDALISTIGQVIEDATSAEVTPPNESNINRDRNSIRVLMVEDNKMNQRVQLRLLDMLKFQTDVAVDGKEGLDTFIRGSEGEGYDLVLMDCHMPVMDGFESTKAIREYEKQNHLPHTHIVALTAGEHNIKPETGMCGIIQKPIKKQSFESQLAKYLFHKECQTVTYEREQRFEMLNKAQN